MQCVRVQKLVQRDVTVTTNHMATIRALLASIEDKIDQGGLIVKKVRACANPNCKTLTTRQHCPRHDSAALLQWREAARVRDAEEQATTSATATASEPGHPRSRSGA